MLIYLGCCTVLAFAAAILLALRGDAPAAAAHAAFAAGAMPLIFAAMGHFVPVLTRSAGAGARIGRLPLVLQGVGILVVGVLAGVFPGAALHAALAVGLAATAGMLAWVLGRGRKALGRPHPGLYWYAAALGCLILALLAIAAGLVWPAIYPLARLAHLHLNTLGFIGLSAIGTLHVLMPTALGQPDPRAASRLTRQLPWMLAGVAAAVLACGLPWLSLPAAVLVGGVAIATLAGWLRGHGIRRLLADGVAASLLLATAGFAGLALMGAAHGVGLLPGRPAVAAFFTLFLLPLVTGALSQLLPVWRYPGPLTPARTALRACLAGHGLVRAVLFLAGGLLLPVNALLGAGLVAGGVLLFAAALAVGLLRRA
ncbi:hypothetical protein [Zoogloea dura]|uniref:Uncharacterized protein n=1 Tax=Zoogloea dura TaxID=2728840 RepID=A0A848G4L6_9RHOO|nr:hypothetical protein [Zoogloea dura]NML26110.1 hypothetical protein [Zoogloea dura]